MSKGLFFLDSGAHSLFNKYVFKLRGTTQDRFAYYRSQEFWDYVDSYAKFVKEHLDIIDYYVNVDVISNPELSWKVQKYLENEHGLSPIPVIHAHAPLKWVERHLDAGYRLLGLGGVALEGTSKGYMRWADQVFSLICPASNNQLPLVKVHGFAMTNYRMMMRYPFWSVDSAAWTKAGAFGYVLVPHKRRGEFIFSEEPYQLAISIDSPHAKKTGRHYETLAPMEKKILCEWLEVIDVPLGVGSGDDVKEYGVINRHTERKIANLLFFEMFRASLPEWPWPFVRKGVLV